MPLTLDELGIKRKDPKPVNTSDLDKKAPLTMKSLSLNPDGGNIDETHSKVSSINPDTAAKKLTISDVTGVRPSALQDERVDELHQHVTKPKPSDLINPRDTPAMARELSKAENMMLAQDDLENLSLTERFCQGYRKTADYGYRRFMDTTKRFWNEAAGIARMTGQSMVPETLFPEASKAAGNLLAAVPSKLAEMSTPVEKVRRYGIEVGQTPTGWSVKPAVKDFDVEAPGWLNMVAGEVIALPLILTNLAAQGMKGKIPLPYVMAGESLFSTYEETGGDKGHTLLAGGEGYMFGSILHGLHMVPSWMGVKYLTGPLKPIPARILAGAGAFGIPTAAGGGSPDEIIAQSVLGAGFYFKDAMVSIPEVMGRSKLAQRSPKLAEDLLRKQLEKAGMQKTAFIDSAKIMELDAHTRKNLLKEFAIEEGDFAEMVQLGQPVAFDSASLLARLPKEQLREAYEVLKDHVKVSEYEDVIINAQKAEVDGALEALERQYDYLFQKPIEMPREPLEQLHEQIVASGRPKREADIAVALYEAHARAMGARSGMSPAEYMEWRNLEVRKEEWSAFKERLEQKGVDPNKQTSYDPNSFRAAATPESTAAASSGERGRVAGREEILSQTGKPDSAAATAVSGLSFKPDAVPPHLKGKADLATRIDTTTALPGRPGLRRANGVVSRGFGEGKPTEILYTARDYSRFGSEAHDPVHWEAMKDIVIVDERMGTDLWSTSIPKDAKLEGQPLIQMSKGCHRNGALLSAINDGIILPDVAKDLVSCHGSCYKNYDQGAKSGGSIFNKILTKARRGTNAAEMVQPMADFLSEALGVKLKPADFKKPKKGSYTKRFEAARKKFMSLGVDEKAAVWNKLADTFPDLYAKWQPQESQGVRVMHPDVIRKKIAKMTNKEFLSLVNSPSAFIRGNQQGDWLMELRGQDKNGITSWEAYAEAMLSKYEKATGNPRSEFPIKLSAVTTGWYADVPMEILRRIADKYGDHLVIQVTGPIDFPGPEGALRLQGFKKLHDAGLNPVMRLITDEFMVGGSKLNDRKTVEMTMDFIIDNGIRPEQILETPLHLESPKLKTTRISPKDSEGVRKKKLKSVAEGLDESWQLPIEERELLAKRVLERNEVFFREDKTLPEDMQKVGHTEVGLTYDTLRKMGIPAAKLKALQELGFYYKFNRNGAKQEGVFSNRCCTTGKCITCDSQCSAKYMDAIKEGRQQHAVQILEQMSPSDASATLVNEMNQLGQMRLKGPETLYQVSRSGETLVNEFIGKNPAYRDIRFDGVWDPFAGVDMGGKEMPKYLQFTVIDGPQWVNGQKRARPTFNVEIKKDWTPEEAYESFRSKLQEFKEQWGDHETLFQSQAPWYSVMETVLEKKLPKSSSAENMLQQVRAYQGKNEFKAEEMEWSDIEGYLESRAGEKVTKQEIMEHVRRNQVKLIETVKEDSEMVDNILDVDAWNLRTRMGRTTGFTETYEHPELPDVFIERVHNDKWRIMLDDQIVDDSPRSLIEAVEKMPSTGLIEEITATTSNTNHPEWQMEGGPKSNYRETLIRLDNRGRSAARMAELYREREAISDKYFAAGKDIAGEDLVRWNEIEREVGELSRGNRSFVNPTHFTEENILVHIRHNDRIGPNGERILFIEEVQSDWAQTGRKKGFVSREEVLRYKELEKMGADASMAEREELASLADKMFPGVPDMPYKKTPAWAGLAMRKMVRYAAENGYDAIAWTPGEVQNARYDLSKQVDSVNVMHVKDDVVRLSVLTKSHASPISLDRIVPEAVSRHGGLFYDVPKAKLEDVVGKDMAKKILEGGDGKEYIGEDLQVGGKGMKGFYDEILPSIMKKTFGKKSWGKPKVELKGLHQRIEEDIMNGIEAEEGAIDVWSMPITGEMRAKATREPMPLFQNDGKPLGATTFERQKTAITFFEKANKSTMPHELFHVFMDDMQKLAFSGKADPQLKKDWQTTLDFLGAKWGEELTVEQKEKFAKAGEVYLREGKAPTPALTKAFASLRKWLLNIYRSIRPLDVKIDDDMRQVFDRLLATEEEISAAKDFMELKAYWLEGEGKQLIGEKAWSDYKQALGKAGEAADTAIRKKRIIEYNKLLKGWKKDAEKAAAADPEAKFIDELRGAGGINRKAFEMVFGKKISSAIAREHPKLFSNKAGETVQELVDRYGMSGPDEMLGMLTSARNRKRIAQELVIEKSREYDKTFQSDEAVLTPEYSALLAKEAAALEAQVKERVGNPLTDKQIERLVRGRMGRMSLEEVAKVYMTEGDSLKATMQMAAKASRTAFAAGDFEGALKEKNRQRAIIAKMRERKKISDEVKKRRARLKRNAKTTQPKKGNKKSTVNWEHAEQVRALLSRYDVGIKTGVVRPDKLQSLEEFIRENDDDTGAMEVIPMWLRNASDTRKVTKLTLSELRDLDNAVQVLTYLGRNENRLLDSIRKEEVGEAIEEMSAKLAAHKKQRGEPQHFKAMVKDEKTGELKVKMVPYTRRDKSRLQSASEAYDTAGLVKPEFIFREADHYDRGPFYDYLFRWAADAEVREYTMWEDVASRLDKAFSNVPMKERKAWGRKEHYVPNPTGALAEQLRKRPFSREEIIMVALNSGNEGNLKALREGYGWNMENVRSITNMLTPQEWQVVRGIWDIYEHIRPELEKTNRKLTGTEMELVDGVDVETPYGVVQGGYFPLKFDEELSWRAGEQHQKDIDVTTQQNKYRVATTQSGMTKSRVGGAMPPRLKMDVAYETLMDSIHHTTHGVGVRDAGRLIQNPEFRATFEQYMGAEKYAQLMPWLQHIANPRPQYKDKFEYYLNKARMNSTVVTLGLKATTALKQVSAYTLTVDAVGLKPAIEAARIFYTKPRETSAWIYEKSPYMRSRVKSWDREVADMMRQWDPSAWKFKVGDKYVGKAELNDLFFSWITAMDRAVAMPTWVAGYREGMKKYKGDEKMAIDHADMTVRTTQASASLKDLCGWQRGGPAKKILVPFYTAASVTLNRMMETKNKYRDGKITAGEAMMGFFWVLAAQSMIETWAGKPGIPDKDTKAKDVAKEATHGILDMFVGSFPIARDVGRMALDKAFTGRYWGYDGPPAAGIIQAPGELGVELFDAAAAAVGPERMTDKDYRQLRKKTIETGGYMFGLPANATNQAIDGAMALTKGETKNPFVLFYRQRKE